MEGAAGHSALESDALRDELRRQKLAIATAHAQLNAIHGSTAWRLVRVAYGLVRRLLPPKTIRYRTIRKCARGLVRLLTPKSSTLLQQAATPVLDHLPPQSPNDIISPDTAYSRWIWLNEPLEGELVAQSRVRFDCQPLISVIVPTFETPLEFLDAMIKSVLAQSYANWELCIADGGSTTPRVAETLARHAAADSRIKVYRLDENRGIAGNTNAAMALASGEFVAFLDHDDVLAPFALHEIVRAINRSQDADLIYSDEDKLDRAGRIRWQPHMKPDWSPDTLRSHNYICHLCVMRRTLVEQLGGMRSEFNGAQDHDLILRASEKARRIVHVPKILYHWRAHQESTAQDRGAKLHASDAGARAVADHLRRIGCQGEVRPSKVPGTYSIRYALVDRPLVSIIIPNRDQADALRRCIESIGASTYDRYQIIVVENGSREPATRELYCELKARANFKLLHWEQPFNYSAVNNFAVRHSDGEMLLFLNNDVESLHADWLERILEHAVRPGVGAVGAKLFYPDGTLQHAGVVIGMGGNAAHIHGNAPADFDGYFGRLTYVQNYSAVTAACLMCRRNVFDEAGGFDERFALSYNDVDFCLKLAARGYVNVWTPEARLRHWESKTRGPDNSPEKASRFQRESALLWERWRDLFDRGDPCYSPNLTLTANDCGIRA